MGAGGEERHGERRACSNLCLEEVRKKSIRIVSDTRTHEHAPTHARANILSCKKKNRQSERKRKGWSKEKKKE